jgi:hypothetical protein
MSAGMSANRVFFPQAMLDAWISDERVDVTYDVLVLKDESRQYKIVEALHVVKDVAGGGDTHKLLGRVKTREQLTKMGAEVLETSLIVGDDAYDVVPGFVGEPMGAFTERPPSQGAAAVQNDEDLLAQFLVKSL